MKLADRWDEKPKAPAPPSKSDEFGDVEAAAMEIEMTRRHRYAMALHKEFVVKLRQHDPGLVRDFHDVLSANRAALGLDLAFGPQGGEDGNQTNG